MNVKKMVQGFSRDISFGLSFKSHRLMGGLQRFARLNSIVLAVARAPHFHSLNLANARFWSKICSAGQSTDNEESQV